MLPAVVDMIPFRANSGEPADDFGNGQFASEPRIDLRGFRVARRGAGESSPHESTNSTGILPSEPHTGLKPTDRKSVV